MGLVKEPKGVDFIIQSAPLTPSEEEQLSAFIKARKAALQKKKTASRSNGNKKKKKIAATAQE